MGGKVQQRGSREAGVRPRLLSCPHVGLVGNGAELLVRPSLSPGPHMRTSLSPDQGSQEV